MTLLDDAVAAAPDLLAGLVGFPSVSTSTNLPLLDWVEEQVAGHATRTRRFPNAEGDKANLLVSFGPDEPGGLVWSGHTDVVPVDGQAWTGDPFTLRGAEGRLIGRGATDMKGFLACCLALAPWLAAASLRRPVRFAFSYDEELGCKGVQSMVDGLAAAGDAPALAVIGEPSKLQVVDMHKGGLIGWARLTGTSGHSSQPDRYVNAVMAAGEFIAFVNRLRAELRDGPQHPPLDPPYSTIQVNQIHGGTAGNIVPEACDLFWEMRCVPGVSTRDVLARMQAFVDEALLPGMRAVDARAGIELDVVAAIPALAPNADPAIERDLMAHLGQATPGAKPSGTEAGVFQEAGIPAIVFGPGETAQSHQPDEFIAQDQLARCVPILAWLAGRCCTA
ncbi:MAG: argE [Solirubrobacterales bacterium]|nr:argE [Solirubrobacterales bacterium]